MSDEFIFVYGTLRRGVKNAFREELMRDLNYIGQGVISGRLYEVEDYPGAILSDNSEDRVIGEVYNAKISSGVFDRLDAYEECTDAFPRPHEYVRKQVSVNLSDGNHIFAWAYIFTRDVSGLIRITSGDYVEFLSRASK